MLFVSGLMGPYMAPIPANASAAMILSFFVAVIITPWLMVRFGKVKGHGGEADDGGSQTGLLGRAYIAVAKPILARRKSSWIFLLAVGGATLLSLVLFATKSVTVKLLPFDNKPELQVVVDLPRGASLEATDRVLQEAARRLSGLEELSSIQAYAGTAAPFNFNGLVRHYYLRDEPQQGDLQINLLPKGERSRTSHEIALDIRKRLKGLAAPEGTTVKVVEVPPGPPVIATLLAEIYGPDAETRRAVAREVRQIFKDVPFIVDDDDSFRNPAPRLRVSIDQDNLEYHKVEESDVYDTIQAYLGGVAVGYSHRGGGRHPVEIAVQLPKKELAITARALTTPVPANALPGERSIVELGDVVSLKSEQASYPIFRHNGRNAEMVMGELAGAYEAPLYGMMAVADAINKKDWGKLGTPEIRLHGQPEDESKPVAALGRRMGGDLCYLPRYGRGVRRRSPWHLYSGRGAVRLVQAAARGADADSADPDRHHDRPLAVRRAVLGDLDDRLHRACRHHRAQFDPADRLHSGPARGGCPASAGAARSRGHSLQADPSHRACRHDRRGGDPRRSDLPGARHLAAVRFGLIDAAHRTGDTGNLYRAPG